MAKTLDIYLHGQQLHAARQIDMMLRPDDQAIDVVCDDTQIECAIITSLMPVLLPVIGVDTMMTVHSAAALSMGRYRLLNEMDAIGLGQYDAMQLSDVDYIDAE